MELTPFQISTVDVASTVLKSNGPRRFLVADEVGLGKTIIARTIAQRLRTGRKLLNVMYLCPSLAIAGQNRPKFVSLTGIDPEEYHPGGDRLALVPGWLPKDGNGFRVFTFTPETSLPGWKPGPRTGRKAERELIRAVLERFPKLLSAVTRLDLDRSACGRRPLFTEGRSDLNGFTAIGIERAMRDVFDCQSGSIEKAVLGWLEREDTDLLEFVGRFRSVLALAALRLRTVKPDLVILDEFHRYADLVVPKAETSNVGLKQERARIHWLLKEALLGGDDRPAVLLLSATPYKLRRLDGKEIHEVDNYRSLIDLVGFLAGDEGYRAKVEEAMREYHRALRTIESKDTIRASVLRTKERLEALLRPLMARTERALVHKEDLFDRDNPQVSVETQDLVVFKHFAETVGSEFAGWAPAMWTSIPYPSQTMHGYKIWKSLQAATPAPIQAGSRKGNVAHPQLRHLDQLVGDPAHLSLPWQPPTVAWWRLEGPWSDRRPLPGKTLLFSRWRGAPTAISALLSIKLSGGLRKPKAKAPVPLLRPGGSETGALVGLFMPWPNLPLAIEPQKSKGMAIGSIRADARRQLEKYLQARRIRLDGTEKRPTWIVAAGIEHEINGTTYQRVSSLAAKASSSLKAKNWSKLPRINRISRAELTALSDHLLSSPGSILARCLARHNVPQDRPRDRQRTFSFSWESLRRYLGNRAFAKLVLSSSKKKRYPDALADAMLKGGFEAVLDEQMCLLSRFGDAEGLEIVDQLSAGLLDRPGLVQFRHSGTNHRVPVQAVIPFAGGQRSRGGKKGGKRFRSDILRHAFNSPFWPHMLCTTSIGQEGLDFHLWCSRIVHWDLPSDPVDFEQREGRIARYGSLAVRRSLAREHGVQSLGADRGVSPFGELISLARRVDGDRTGLERWWLPANGRPTSISFDWRFSHRAARRERMLEELLYYRLALGQPDPEAFVTMLRNIDADETSGRELAIDLSAISRDTTAQ
ncbi:DEAD/DEAH box helicase [Roseovarius confluentis]|uniref:DEAD/DEAH box helicase n=1 Tax=Roseovarius confluentis TaxID=1852027 RepID=UPI000CDDB186|nr:DEAD/DEAH box helicase [Roseovarius confluentis]